jgi:hypothetical protein
MAFRPLAPFGALEGAAMARVSQAVGRAFPFLLLASIAAMGRAQAQPCNVCTQLATLQSSINTLQASVSALQTTVNTLQASVNAQRKRFYATKGSVLGGDASTACATGYHVASLWEISDPSNLTYDTSLGFTWPHQANGPPNEYPGWIEIGGGSDCAGYTSPDPDVTGTAVRLPIGFELFGSAATPASPWQLYDAVVLSCGISLPVWCASN